jgi:aspartyl-tRNA(Asn)/glutamyl-tRNA(Gln) amidotransferase subunit A
VKQLSSDERWTIVSASDAMRAGRLTPVDLVERCFQQIDRFEPKVRAWVFVDRDEARRQAEQRTAELQSGRNRGPLHGIPIGVKDIFDVADWPTAAGSERWARADARHDCDIVRQLRQAGVIFLGKTVTTAYASFDPPATRNPWNLSRTPGGSSSGSAAAVATGMCLAALASQTGGSITRPASYCGVSALKPTYGRASLQGIVPLAHSMDHPGVMANGVEDLAILLQALADATVSPAPADYTARLRHRPPFLEVGRFAGLFDVMEPAMRSAYEKALGTLREAGLEIIDCPLPASFAEVTARHQTIMAVEAAMFHEERFRRHPDDYPPRIRSLIEEGLRVAAPEYARAKEHQRRATTEILHSFVDGVAVALTPATPGPAPDAATTGLPTFNSPWSYTGLPTVSLPIGWTDDGLPLALQLVGRPFDEAELLQASLWCEQALAVPLRLPG